MLYCLSLLISFLCAHGLLQRYGRDLHQLNRYLYFFLTLGLGQGLSATISFYSFVFFNQLNKPFILLCHISILILTHKNILLTIPRITAVKHPRHWLNTTSISFLLILLALIPVGIQAYFFPMGGWDAWSAWNLKAKFLFIGQQDWQNLLDPVLWRSSPHYPLLLPLINVWGWIFYKEPVPSIPLLTSLVFSFTTVGTLWAGLSQISSKSCPKINRRITSGLTLPLLLTLSLLTLPLFTKLSSSQYCDIVLSFYLLGSMICLILSQRLQSTHLSGLAGIFLGFLSFTKTEGTTAAGILLLLGCFYLGTLKQKTKKRNLILPFLIGALIAGTPTILFQILYAPENQTFINGLTSSEKGSSWLRLKYVLVFLLVELNHAKWNGLWWFSGLGILVGFKNAFKKEWVFAPLFLFSYLGVIIFYYYLNTYFEITWWLQVSLHRILFAVLPLLLFWVGCSLFDQETHERGSVKPQVLGAKGYRRET